MTNPWDAPAADLPVRLELDFGQLAVEAGWPSHRLGDRVAASGFTFDSGSVRVLAYGAQFGAQDVAEVPSRFEPFWREAVPPGPFNPASRPYGTVSWIVEGSLAPRQTRNYVVYFDVLEDGGPRTPASHTPVSLAPLDSQESIGRGTVFGLQTAAANVNRLRVTALLPGTQVTVFEVSNGRPRLHRSLDEGQPNPFTIAQAGALATYSLEARRFYKVVTDRPSLAATQCLSTPASASAGGTWYPSTAGGLLGLEFLLDGMHGSVWAISPSLDEVPALEITGFDGSVARPELTAGNFLQVDGARRIRVLEGPPILVQALRGPADGFVPLASETGGTVGTRLAGAAPPGGSLLMGSFQAAAEVRGFSMATGRQVLPGGSASLLVPPGPANVLRIDRTDSNTMPSTPLQLGVPPPGEGGPVYSYGSSGPGEGLAAMAPGLRGRLFHVPALGTDLNVYAPFADTDVSAQNGQTNTRETLTLARDQTWLLDGDIPWTIEASKPIAIEPVQVRPNCARFLAGFGGAADATILGVERRGYAIQLVPVHPTGDPAIALTSPGREAVFQFDVRNLARWSGGQLLADTAHLSLEGVPPGWGASLAAQELPLSPGGSASVQVRVTPGPDARAGDAALFRVVARSAGNPSMQDSAAVAVVIQVVNGVHMWFGSPLSENGPVEDSRRVSPGSKTDYPIMVRNIGSASDTFQLSAATNPFGPDWQVELLMEGVPARTVALEPAERKALILRVAAPPDAGQASTSLISTAVQAISTTHDGVSAKVTATTRLRPALSILIEPDRSHADAPPGGVVEFRLTVANEGNETITASLATSGLTRPGWSVSLPVDNVLLQPRTSFTVPLSVTVGIQAAAKDYVVLHVLAEARVDSGPPGDTDRADLTIAAQSVHRLAAKAAAALTLGSNGRTLWPVEVENQGNGFENVTIRAADLPPGLRLNGTNSTLLAPGANATFLVALVAPSDFAPGVYPLELAAETKGGGRLAIFANLTVLERRTGEIQLLAEAPVIAAGGTLTLQFRTTNTGNTPGRFDVTLRLMGLEGAPASHRLDLSPGESGMISLELAVPPSASWGNRSLEVQLVSVEDPSARSIRAWPLLVGAPDLAVDGLRRGGDGLVRLFVENRGDAVARDVVVELRDDRVVHDRVVLEAVAPQGRQVVVLRPLRGEPIEIAAVRIDPDGTNVDRDPSNNVQALDVASRAADAGNGLPAPNLAALLVNVVGAVLVLRRRRSA